VGRKVRQKLKFFWASALAAASLFLGSMSDKELSWWDLFIFGNLLFASDPSHHNYAKHYPVMAMIGFALAWSLWLIFIRVWLAKATSKLLHFTKNYITNNKPFFTSPKETNND
jgi:hypothetical protein